MGSIFLIIVGVAIGYFFKPQLDVLVGKVVKSIKDNRDKQDNDFS